MSIFNALLIAALLLEICILIAVAIDRFMGGEDFQTSRDAIPVIANMINASKYKSGMLYDLGSCRGHFVFAIQKRCPQLRVVGIDNSLVRVLTARVLAALLRSPVAFMRDDIFHVDTTAANIVYLYVPRHLLPQLETKLRRELQPGSLVIMYRICFPTWVPTAVHVTDVERSDEEKVFLYQV